MKTDYRGQPFEIQTKDAKGRWVAFGWDDVMNGEVTRAAERFHRAGTNRGVRVIDVPIQVRVLLRKHLLCSGLDKCRYSDPQCRGY